MTAQITDTFLYQGDVYSPVSLKGGELFVTQQFAFHEDLPVGEVSWIAFQDLHHHSIQGGRECS
jgi:hypothetical protein